MHPDTKRRKRLPARVGGKLTDAQEEQLVYGITLRGGGFPFPSMAAARRAWFRHRDALLLMAAADAHGRGRYWRPWGAEQFD